MAGKKNNRKKLTVKGIEVLALTLTLCVLISGILIIHQSNERRETYTQLAELRSEQDSQLSEHSRLLLERDSLSSYRLVLTQAQERGFKHPESFHLASKEMTESE